MVEIHIEHNPILSKTIIKDTHGKDITLQFDKKYTFENRLCSFSTLTSNDFLCSIGEFFSSGANRSVKIKFSGIENHFNAFLQSASHISEYDFKVVEEKIYRDSLYNVIDNFISNGGFSFNNLENYTRLGNVVSTAEKDLYALKDDDGFNIFVVGSTNSGKSAFVNSLIGADIMPMSSNSCTSLAYKIVNSKGCCVEFGSYLSGKIKVNFGNEIEVISDSKSKITNAIKELVSEYNISYKTDNSSYKIRNIVLSKLIGFINSLPELMREDGSQVDDFILDGDVIIHYPIAVQLPVDNFAINDTPGHTDSANGGEHFQRLADAIKNDTANTVLIFVTRPDNPSTVDNAYLIDSIFKLNRSLDTEYSFFVISHADLIGRNTMSIYDGSQLTEEERLAEFDRLIECNSIRGEHSFIKFSDRKVFFVDSYKTLLAHKFPEMIDGEGYMPYEYDGALDGSHTISNSVLPYYKKNQSNVDGLGCIDILDECHKILDGNGNCQQKAFVRTGFYSISSSLCDYINKNKDIIGAKKLYNGAVSRLHCIIEEIATHISQLEEELQKLNEHYSQSREFLSERLSEKLSSAKFIFDGKKYFSKLEKTIEDECVKEIRNQTQRFAKIKKNDFISLYNECHAETRITSLKGVNADVIEQFKEDLKRDAIENRLNSLYIDTVINGFFNSQELRNEIGKFKDNCLEKMYEDIVNDKRLIGIAKPQTQSSADLELHKAKEFAVINIKGNQVSLKWNKYTKIEKFKSTVAGFFNPKNKVFIKEKLELDEEYQRHSIRENWQVVEEAIGNAVVSDFLETEFSDFSAKITSDDSICQITSLRDEADKINADNLLIDSLLRDREKVLSITKDIDKLFFDILN